jgi:hypothetical protein
MGHLLEPNMMIAFSIDKLSLGREAAVHIFVVTGSSRRAFIEIPSLSLSPLLVASSLQRVSRDVLN